MNFTEGELAYLTEIRSLSVDAHGNVIFVGLSAEESLEYKRYVDDFKNRHNWQDMGETYLQLHEKHETARISVVIAESELRRDQPIRH